MKRSLWTTVVLLACGGGDSAPEPAELLLKAPAAVSVAPSCAAPVARLYLDGEPFSCTVATATPQDGSPPSAAIFCPADKGLMSDTPYVLEVVYLQGAQVVARGAVLPNPTQLSSGRNELQLPLEQVDAAVDANGNGTPEMQEACP